MSTIALSIGGETVTTKLAMRMEDSLQAFAVRAACFIGELDVPYSEEFDGHDFGATHVIAYVGDEPVGTLRVRWFQSFAMPERLAVIQRFRGHNIGQLLLERARKLAESRGCNMLYAQVLPADVKYWEKQGWRRLVAEDASPATSASSPWCGRSIPASRCPTSRRRNWSCCAAKPSSTLRACRWGRRPTELKHSCFRPVSAGRNVPLAARIRGLLKARDTSAGCRVGLSDCMPLLGGERPAGGPVGWHDASRPSAPPARPADGCGGVKQGGG